MKVEVVTMPPLHAVFIRHVGPYMGCGAAWSRLTAWAGARGLFAHSPRAFGLSHDDPASVPAEELRYDACMTAPDGFAVDGEVSAKEILGGEYARHRVIGPFSGLAPAFVAMLHEWMPSSGWTLRAGPFVEEYVSDPDSTPVHELITDLYIPVRRAS